MSRVELMLQSRRGVPASAVCALGRADHRPSVSVWVTFIMCGGERLRRRECGGRASWGGRALERTSPTFQLGEHGLLSRAAGLLPVLVKDPRPKQLGQADHTVTANELASWYAPHSGRAPHRREYALRALDGRASRGCPRRGAKIRRRCGGEAEDPQKPTAAPSTDRRRAPGGRGGGDALGGRGRVDLHCGVHDLRAPSRPARRWRRCRKPPPAVRSCRRRARAAPPTPRRHRRRAASTGGSRRGRSSAEDDEDRHLVPQAAAARPAARLPPCILVARRAAARDRRSSSGRRQLGIAQALRPSGVAIAAAVVAAGALDIHGPRSRARWRAEPDGDHYARRRAIGGVVVREQGGARRRRRRRFKMAAVVQQALTAEALSSRRWRAAAALPAGRRGC